MMEKFFSQDLKSFTAGKISHHLDEAAQSIDLLIELFMDEAIKVEPLLLAKKRIVAAQALTNIAENILAEIAGE